MFQIESVLVYYFKRNKFNWVFGNSVGVCGEIFCLCWMGEAKRDHSGPLNHSVRLLLYFTLKSEI